MRPPASPAVLALITTCLIGTASAQRPGSSAAIPATADPRVAAIGMAASPERIERSIRQLAAFGTRHTLSDTLSATRGIGAARRWVKAEFDRISSACGKCLEVRFQRTVVPGTEGSRIPLDVEIVNVVALQRGGRYPGRYVVMSAHLDSRASDPLDATGDAPGADDDASGVAAVLEAARILSTRRFDKTIVYAALSGEEQGLFGGTALAAMAKDSGWTVEGVLNNDIVGNTEGIGGARDNRTFRVFSEPVAATETDSARQRRRFTGGEVDGPSRQLARYVDRIVDQYLPAFDARMIYRLDRFGRGGDHRPFNDAGFPAVRLTESVENYNRQHQDIRSVNGVLYGDVADAVDFAYAAQVAGVNAAALAALAWAPAPPDSVTVGGALSASTTLTWRRPAGPAPLGYKVYWRETTAPQWTRSVYVGAVTEYTLADIVIDDHLFGVASVGPAGNESVVKFPVPAPAK